MIFRKQKYPKDFSYEEELDRLEQADIKIQNAIERCESPNEIYGLLALSNKVSWHRYRLDQIDKEFTR